MSKDPQPQADKVHMSKFKRGLRLAGQSWQVLRGHRGLLAYPIVGALVAIVLVGPPAAAGAYLLDDGSTAPGVALLVLAAYLVSFITAFVAVGLATAADAAMRGEPIGFGQGCANATRHLPAIAGWALINAILTVGLRALETRGELARIAAGLIGGAWSVISLMAIPAIAFEGSGPVHAIKRSVTLFKEHWGGQVTGMAAIGIGVFLCGMLPAIALIVVGVLVLGGDDGAALLAGGGLLIAIGFVLLAVSTVLASALRQVFAVALYRYATAGVAPQGFSTQDLEQAVHRGGQTGFAPA
jgi:uncharacterized protein DUF6159